MNVSMNHESERSWELGVRDEELGVRNYKKVEAGSLGKTTDLRG